MRTKELEMTKETILDNLRNARRDHYEFDVALRILRREDDCVVDEDDEELLKELEAEKEYWESLYQADLKKERELREKAEKEYNEQQAQEELREKVENVKIRKKDGTLNSYTVKAINWCLFEKSKGNKYKVYTKEWTGSGNYYNLIDYTPRIIALLGERNYKYTEGNDSKQGGQNSYYIEISKLAYNYIQEELNKNK